MTRHFPSPFDGFRKLRRRGGAAPAVDPDALMGTLLADGAHFALDTSGIANKWQDSLKAGAVTASGQEVGAADSVFGTTVYTLTNPTAGTLPSYDSDGWFLFDGVDQTLFGSGMTSILTNQPAAFHCGTVWVNSLAAVRVLISVRTNSTSSRFTVQINTNGSVSLNVRRLDGDANTAITSATGAVTAGGYYTISSQVICSTGEMKIWVNGLEVASGTLINPGAAFSNTASSASVRIGMSVAGTQFFSGYMRRPVLLRKSLSDADRATVEEWTMGIRSYAGGYIVALGIDTWFNSTEMAKKGSKAYFGTVDDGVAVYLNEWDMANNKARTIHKTSGVLTTDDHNAGGTVVLADGNILWMPVDHNGSNLRAVLGLPGSFTDTSLQAQIGQDGYSYTQIVQLDGETNDPIYVFTRIPAGVGDERDQWLTVSSDGGTAWSSLVQQFSNPTSDRPYPQFCKISSTRIGCLISDAHPDEAPFNTSIHFGYFESGVWREADGTSLGAVPIDVTGFTKIFDGPTNDPSWTWDLRRIGSETVGLFASFPTLDNHRYHRTVIQDDGSFENEVIYDDAGLSLYGAAPSTAPHYSGGMCVHPTNKDIVYACISKPAVRSGKHQLYRLDRVSAGVWSETQLTDTDDEWFRPNVVSGALICRYGPYSTYESFVGCRTWGMKL
jgi:hypothetical protein